MQFLNQEKTSINILEISLCLSINQYCSVSKSSYLTAPKPLNGFGSNFQDTFLMILRCVLYIYLLYGFPDNANCCDFCLLFSFQIARGSFKKKFNSIGSAVLEKLGNIEGDNNKTKRSVY